jgi:hypothetical protein
LDASLGVATTAIEAIARKRVAPPGLIAGERPGRGASGKAPLEIDVGERLSVVVADNEAGVSRLTFG